MLFETGDEKQAICNVSMGEIFASAHLKWGFFKLLGQGECSRQFAAISRRRGKNSGNACEDVQRVTKVSFSAS